MELCLIITIHSSHKLINLSKSHIVRLLLVDDCNSTWYQSTECRIGLMSIEVTKFLILIDRFSIRLESLIAMRLV